MQNKKCSRCSDTKPFNDFNNHCRKPDGKQVMCRDCDKADKVLWRTSNVDKARANCARRRARKRNLIHPLHDSSKELVLINRARDITITTGLEHQVDHILPLNQGGAHHHDNLQVMLLTDNMAKGDCLEWKSDKYKHWTDLPEHLLEWSYLRMIANIYIAHNTF